MSQQPPPIGLRSGQPMASLNCSCRSRVLSDPLRRRPCFRYQLGLPNMRGSCIITSCSSCASGLLLRCCCHVKCGHARRTRIWVTGLDFLCTLRDLWMPNTRVVIPHRAHEYYVYSSPHASVAIALFFCPLCSCSHHQP